MSEDTSDGFADQPLEVIPVITRYAFDTQVKDEPKRTFFVYTSSGEQDAKDILLDVISEETQILEIRESGHLEGNILVNQHELDIPGRPEDVRPSGRQYQAPGPPASS